MCCLRVTTSMRLTWSMLSFSLFVRSSLSASSMTKALHSIDRSGAGASSRREPRQCRSRRRASALLVRLRLSVTCAAQNKPQPQPLAESIYPAKVVARPQTRGSTYRIPHHTTKSPAAPAPRGTDVPMLNKQRSRHAWLSHGLSPTRAARPHPHRHTLSCAIVRRKALQT